MDDRQPVSLARRALSYLICYLVAVQPMLPAVAAQITPVTPGTQMDAAGNGVPVVNIATPNAAGISHNQYQQYNVGQEGVILNNATGQLNQTQLGGLIQNNPHLKAGHEAQAIINEVVGANRSQLQGYTEVAGKAANVMVANPYGITCNGCGFINTPNVTLTTGKPQLDANGNLSALAVSKGSVIVEGKGLDGSSADAVSIVARATEINAGIHAKDLSVTVGANRVGKNGSVTPIAGEGAAPSVAVDTGALGGMYANRIHLVSSEKGVGVNLGNLVAKQGDIQLDANGRLTLNNSLSSGQLTANGSSVMLGGENKASGHITVNAQQDATLSPGTLVSDAGISINAKGSLTANGANLTAGRDIQLGGAAVAMDSHVVAKAGNDIRLQAQDRLSNSGQLTAGKNLNITANQLDNRGMLAGSRTGITTRSLQNSTGAAISGAESLTLSSDSLLNQGVLSAPVLSLSSGQTDNSGLIQGSRTLTFSGNRLNNLAGGTLNSENSFALNLPQLSNSGLITSKAELTLSGDALTNRGEINAASLFASNAQLNNEQGGLLLADNTLSLQNGTLTNDGQIAASAINADASTLNNSGTLQGKQSLQASGKAISNGGTLLSDGKLTLSADTLDNRGLLQGQQLAVTAGSWHNSGNALSAGDGVLNTAELDNSGKILGQQSLQLKADSVDNSGWLLAQALTFQGDLVNSGLIQGSDALTVTGDTLTNQASGQMLSGGTLTAQADSLDNHGSMQADTLDMRLQSWQNAGSAQATTQLFASLGGELNNSGTLLSQNDVVLTSNDIVNSGTLAAQRLSLTSPHLTNTGLLQGNSTLSLSSADISNTASGQLISGGSLTLSPVQLTNAGLLQVADDFSLTGRDLTNSGRITATNLRTELSGTLNNDGSITAQQFRASGDVLNNQGLLQGDNGLDASFRQFSNLSAGQLLSNGNLVLKGATADNAGVWQGNKVAYQFNSLTNSGTVYGIDSLEGQSAALLDNRGSLMAGGNASLTADSQQNSGKVLAGNLVLRGSSLSNSGLWQGASALDAQSSGALTQAAGGRTLSGGDLLLNAADLNTAGTLQGENVQISAGRWQNQGLLLGTAGVSADVAGELSNSGEILSQGATQVSAQNLNNSGSLLADKAMTLSGGALNNSGSVQGETLVITPASVTNQGSLIGLQSLTIGPVQNHGFRMLAVQSQPARELINDAGGQLLTQGTLNITGDDITNNGSWQGQQILLNATRLANNGAIQSAGDLTLNISDTLTSAAGSKITANGNAALNALSLINQGQWIAGNLALKGTTLNNSGEISGVNGLTAVLGGTLTQQQNGALLSGGKLDLQAAALSNGGRIQGSDLTVNTGTLTNNGRMQGDNSLLLTTSGRITNNNTGTLISQGGLTLTTPELYNYGLIQGATNRITASSSATNSGKMLSAGELTLTTPQLVNSGWLQAAQLTLNAANASNSGTLLADQQGTLSGSQLLNQGTVQGATLAVNYGQLNNNGTLLGVNQLNVKASQVTQQATGKLFSGGGLLLESTGFDQLGQVVALGNATLKLINSFTARNTLAAGNRLTVTSNGAIDNQGTLQGQAMTLSAGGDFTNNGQLTTGSGDSSLSGNRIVMNGAGTLQGGGNVTLSSRSDVTLNGFTGTRGNLTISSPGSIVNAALLYAGQNLYLYANSIRNQRGDMLAGNSLWMQRDAAGNANGEVINTSGTIESQNGDITIRTGHLLNTREGLSTSEEITPLATPSWANGTNVRIPFSWFKPGDYYQYVSGTEHHHGHGDDWDTYTYSYAPNADVMEQKVAYQSIAVTANASGGAGRIAAGRDLNVQAAQLNNSASSLLARNNMALSGSELNNQSWTDGTTTVYQIYRYSGGASSSSFGYTLDGSPVYETTGTGNVYRSVIQAGNTISADFSQNVSNTSTDPHVSGSVNTLHAPVLGTLTQQTVGGTAQKQSLSTTDKVAVNSPEWKDQVQSALQQVNGVSALTAENDGSATLADRSVSQKGSASLGVTKALSDAGTAAKGVSLNAYQVKEVDNSAYPVPVSDNGYFVVSSNSSSPYLITVNPKLDGLGQLDSHLFGDLNTLLGKQPGSAPQETRQQYTDANTFLGSSYLLDRLNLKPDQDYRFLGDAAFDTRYVSNVVLNQTGSQYLNGTGSDLEQMQYLMDNAAAAKQSLGLQFGVSLSADQVASLDHSILWWESTTINGETVMVPKLYLSAKDTAVNNGSVIAAKNVNVTAGSITNSGSTLLASDSVSLDSKNSISNLNDGLVKAGNGLNLSAIGDIINVSSTFQGKTVALETLNGSINNITLSNPLGLAGNNLKNLQTGSVAAITAEQSLSLNSGKDITLAGSSLSAGGDLLASAWGDISVSANQIATASGRGGYNPVENDKISYQGSQVSAGGNLLIEAGHDVAITASDVSAKGNASLHAANNLQLNAAQTSETSLSGKGNKETHSTDSDSTTLSSGGNLVLTAGQDITSQAAALAAEGDIGLQAGRDINLNAIEHHSGDSERGSKKTVINETVRQQGTEIVSGGSTTLLAVNDITSQASTLTASKDLALQAGHDINISTATESDYAYREETKTKKGLFSKKTTHTISEDSSTKEKASNLSGDQVSIVAGHDLAVKGSTVIGESDVGLKAGNNLSITAATETQSSYRLSETKKSGMFSGGGIGVTFGSASSKQQLKQDGTTESQSASTVGSTGGNVTLVAGHDAHIAGSDVIAKQDISVVGGSVTIDPGNDTLTRRQSFEQKQSGLTLQLTSPITDALLSLGSQAKAASEAGDDRLKALGAVKALESGWAMSQGATQSATALANGDMNNAGIKISLSVGASKSKSSSEYSSNTVSGSSLSGGGNVAVVATGANGTSGDVTLAGSGITGNNVTLAAAHDLNLVAASNNTQQKSSNKSSGWSAGVHIAIGQETGIGVQASGYMASGSENGSSTQYVNSRVNAKDNLTLSSGNDTLLSGAQALGNSISVNAGNNLTLTSLQDTDSYHSQQQSASGGFSFTFGSMTGSFGLSLSKSKINSEYASVGDQSGLFAGDGGYDIFTGNHTQLNGAVIASTADAANNKLSTGTLGWDSIDNHAEYSANSTSVGINLSSSGQQFAGGALPAVVNMHESASGTTRSAVADGTITVRDVQNQKQDVADLSRDTENANGSIGKIFDKEKVANQMAFAQGVQELAGKVVGDVKAYKLDAAAKETSDRLLKEHPEYASLSKDEFNARVQSDPAYKAVADLWGTGGTYSMVATAVAGALGGLSANNLGAAAGGAMAPYIANAIKQATTTYNADGTENVNLVANTMAHAVAGAVLAQISGGSAAAGAAGAAGGELAARAIVAVMFPNTQIRDLTETQKQMVSSLSQIAAGLSGGIAADSSMGVGAGAGAGKNAIENNAFSDGFQLPSGMMNYGQAVSTWNQYAVDNNLTPEQTKEGMNQMAVGEGPSWGVENKVMPTGQLSGDIAIGTGYTLTGSIDDNHFSVDGGSIYGLGAHAGATIGLTFGPYFPGVLGNPEHDYSLNIGAGVVSFGATGNKDGIGISFGVGPSVGVSGTEVHGVDFNGSSTKEIYSHEFR